MAALDVSGSLRVQLLGPVRAWRGDEEINLGSGARRAVFSALALHVNNTVSKADLVDGLWGECPPANAVGIVRIYISDLRRALDPGRGKRADSEVLATVQTSYSLRLPEDQLDERLFAKQQEQAQRHWAAGDLTAAVDALDAALALWHGQALHRLPGPFAETQRARLEESRITAVERRSALLLLRGEHERVSGELTELVAAAPSRETARGLLMVAFNQAGRRADAVQLYRDTERTLAWEQGIEPGPALRRIHQDIAAGNPVPADAISAGIWTPRHDTDRTIVLSGATRPALAPLLVGRDDEIAWLRSLSRDVLNGDGRCVGVEGMAGVGKTALVSAAFAHPDDKYAVAWSSLTEDTDHVVSLVEQLSAARPLVFVVDDLDSVDESGLLAWDRLFQLTLRLPVLLVGVFRTHPTRPLRVRLRQTIGTTGGRLRTIRPLPSRDIIELAERRLDARCGPRLRELLDGAGGNPSFAHQLLDAVTSSSVLHTTAGVADLDEGYETELADELVRLTKQHHLALAPRTRQLLRSAAMLGEQFDLGDLAALMRTTPAGLITPVEEAVLTGRLDADGHRLSFRSTVLLKALVDHLGPVARAALHRDAAEALASAGTPVERVAAHLLAVNHVDAWTARWVLDNIETVATRDQAAAFELLDHVIANTDANEEQRDALTARRTRMELQLGRRPRTAAVPDTPSDVEYPAEMRWILDYLDCRTSDEEAESAVRVDLEHTLDDLGGAEQAARAVLWHATNTSDPVATMDAHKVLWFMATMRRDHKAALAHADSALETLQHTTDRVYPQLDLLADRAFSLQSLDRLDDATHTLARMRYIGDRLRPPAARPHVLTAIHHYWLGRWDEALGHLDRAALDNQDETHDPSGHTQLVRHSVAALVAGHRGDTPALHAHLRVAEKYSPRAGNPCEGSDFHLVATAMRAGVESGVAEQLAAMDPLLDRTQDRMAPRHQWMPRIMRLAMDVGDQGRAAAALRVCRAEAAKETIPARAHAAVRWCQGLAERDPDVLIDVAWRYKQVGRPVEMAAVLVDAAVAFAERGRISLATLTFADALPVLTELGATADFDRAAQRMRGLGVHSTATPVRRQTIPKWGSLSDLERLTVEMVAARRTYPEIAAQLSLSRRDVQATLSAAMRKLGIESRSDLMERVRSSPGEV
ncbi:hypothetical protein ALI144C_04415 [Actinosynnema sp. ALI-1.44]|uniref:BTAD domain-containing putative transcriptional regulator n=1 Tax=Actinosynnema sp. ALI-1.44 TaxID=1933779 RepID=UPI00097BEE5A|nr:BTAD domain-containing putative transcriptional regulator [Actinosynnema sp. ALI-1.44]ONI89592.1 hypothetical protein ALI144C_04415 [Actinosynnema sp. ALI-1.44]